MSVHDCPSCHCTPKEERERQEAARHRREKEERLVREHAVLTVDDMAEIHEFLAGRRQ